MSLGVPARGREGAQLCTALGRWGMAQSCWAGIRALGWDYPKWKVRSPWEQFGSEAALLRLCWHWAHLGSRAGSGQFSGGGQVCVAVWNSLTNAFVPFSPTALHNLYLSF